ncbi:lipoyltransferase [Meredithblackwellia eburnea MCA 4105]
MVSRHMNQTIRRLATSATQVPSCAPAVRPVLPPIRWTYLPNNLPYALGLLLQETLVANRLEAKKQLSSPTVSSDLTPSQLAKAKTRAESDILLLLQHTPVYTAGRREKDPETAKAEADRLGALGADYVSTMRGGQTTYHGPGQLVGYSLMDTAAAQLSTRCYVDYMEKFLETLAIRLGVSVYPIEHTGVFVSPTSKIGSIGIHVRRRITLHGFSMNIEDQTLPWFANVVACGLDEVSATSVATERKRLGAGDPKIKVEDVLPIAVKEFGERYGREMLELGKGDEDADLVQVIQDGVAGRLPHFVPK